MIIHNGKQFRDLYVKHMSEENKKNDNDIEKKEKWSLIFLAVIGVVVVGALLSVIIEATSSSSVLLFGVIGGVVFINAILWLSGQTNAFRNEEYKHLDKHFRNYLIQKHYDGKINWE